MIHGTMTTSSKKDYLSILGLTYEFDENELKKAFRREARKWHPDLNKNDINAEERFKLINEAYEFLSDPKKRKNSSDENINDDYVNNNFKTGFPDFQDYLDSLFGYEYSPKNYEEYDNESFEDESINTNNDVFNNYEYPTTSPEEPPPVKLLLDIETVIKIRGMVILGTMIHGTMTTSSKKDYLSILGLSIPPQMIHFHIPRNFFVSIHIQIMNQDNLENQESPS